MDEGKKILMNYLSKGDSYLLKKKNNIWTLKQLPLVNGAYCCYEPT